MNRLAQQRKAVRVPAISYPPDLPVSARRHDIAHAIRDHQVVVVAGETGSGKTTQIPKILLEMGRGRSGQIGHTQPRRIAARSVAERIASELNTSVGDVVGYQVRFTDQSSSSTLVKVMTDGILLAHLQRDPDLLAYDTIIIDEAHERSLNIDILLGYLARVLPRRPDLKLVITSATIDTDRFARHFSPAHLAEVGGAPAYVVEALPDRAPVVEVTGRVFPVDVRYRPLLGRNSEEDSDLLSAILSGCDELMAEGPGDILVFLTGEREIHEARDALAGHLGQRTQDDRHPGYVELVPLYSRLSAAEQHRVFASHRGRRIVLSTNVAETSLTVPGIRYVVDAGLARISRYSKALKVQRLPIEAISQASANQRSGRCGRVADGIAIRLYSEEDFAARPQFTQPEILRTSLASVLLHMMTAGVVDHPDDVASFPFVDPPDTRAIRDGMALLRELGALHPGTATLTSVGRKIAQFPIDPRLARMVVEGSRHGVTDHVMVLAAALSMQDVRERPVEEREKAEQCHARFVDPTSDFMSILKLWRYLREQQRELSRSAFRRKCKAEYLHVLRIREWQDVVGQLRSMASDVGFGVDATSESKQVGSTDSFGADTAELLHRSVLAGLLSQIGMQDSGTVRASSISHLKGEARMRALRQHAKRARNDYLGARGARFAIFPGSPLSKKPPAWIMAGELVETSRLWARMCASIKPEWAEALAGDLASTTYSEPHWSTRRGAAMVREKVLLYGLPIVAERTVLYSRVDREVAREMFIRHALVEGQFHGRYRFLERNAALVAEAEEVEARLRERGLAADEDVLYALYDERIPDSVVSAAHFDKWWRKKRAEDPQFLTFELGDLVYSGTDNTQGYPHHWVQGEMEWPLSYTFNPGGAADGVTVTIPLSDLARVHPRGFDWMIPGLLNELCVATIRSLPKPVRVQLIPAPDVGREVAEWLRSHTPAWEDMARAGDMAESFAEAFSRAVMAIRGVSIPHEAWSVEREERLPGHLRMTFRVDDEAGGVATGVKQGSGGRQVSGPVSAPDESKDLLSLQRRYASRAEDAVRASVKTALSAAMEEAGALALSESQRDESQQTGRQRTQGQGAQGHSAQGQRAGRQWTAGERTGGHQADERKAAQPGAVHESSSQYSTVSPEVHADEVRRLLGERTRLPASRISSRWTGTQALTLAASPYPSTEALVEDLQQAAVIALTTAELRLPPGMPAVPLAAADITTPADLEQTAAFIREHGEAQTQALALQVTAALAAYRTVDGAVREQNSLRLLGTVHDVQAHAESLIYPGFISHTPPNRLGSLARYLNADQYRLERAGSNINRDADLASRLRVLTAQWKEAMDVQSHSVANPARSAELAGVRWLLEELRVSFFAQHLGTDGSVSEARIRKMLR
ncbi:MAG: ATP-dependent RNA helicase HrpA [Cellulomonadaceae bacterium]|nr:ATP-dependent RNA helicase HrpA [Cellulomonadaceae bacterium]